MSGDDIVFEKVSIAEARAVLRGPDVIPKADDEWADKRCKPLPSDLMLMSDTELWLSHLPQRVKPAYLAEKFPRVVNKIFNVWRRPEACLKIFDELMMDERGTRRGFPLEVAREITNLRVYYTTEVYQMKPDTWVTCA